jgi:MFS family permease
VPFYIALALEGLIFWYAIEKVFMRRIGFSDSDITLAIALMSAITLLTEIPFGILADRTSRKGMLIFSFSLLGLATVIMATAQGRPQYIIGIVCYALYSGSGSGLEDSVIYDTTIEEEKSRKNYEYYYGRSHMYSSITLVISSVLGGWWAAHHGLPATYWLTVPPIVLAITALTIFREPSLHKTTEKTFVAQHLKETLRHIFGLGILRWIVIAMVSVGLMTMFLFEVDQLWPLALGMALVLYGPLNALLLTAYGVAGWLAKYLRAASWRTFILLSLGLAGTCFLMVPHLGLIVIGQILVILCFSAMLIAANGKLHDRLESRYRAGASSVVSSLTSLCFIPLVALFGRIATNHSVFMASLLLPPIALIAIVSFTRIAAAQP